MSSSSSSSFKVPTAPYRRLCSIWRFGSTTTTAVVILLSFGMMSMAERDATLTAVVHVGPEKTGTSSIQHTIRLLQKKGLEYDHYMLGNVYFTNYEPRKFTDCFVASGQRYIENKNYCDEEVVRNIADISSTYHRNLIISTEYLFVSNLDMEKLYRYFTDHWPDVHIVMYYRRFFEWFISLHTQGSRIRPIEKRISIVQHLRHEKETQLDIEEKYVIGVMKRYQAYFRQVHIQNVHSRHNNDVRELFFCGRVIPNGNHTCLAYHEQVLKEQQNVNRPLKRNTRNALIYQEIAYYAKSLDMIDYKDDADENDDHVIASPNKYTLAEVTAKIYHHHVNTLGLTEYDFPPSAIDCPTDEEYEWIYQKSIEFESLLFPQYHAEVGSVEIQNLFPQTKQNLCHVNATTVLLHDEAKWIEFFRTL